MSEIKQASKVDRHNHMLYLKDNGVGVSSIDGKRGEKHQHILGSEDDLGIWLVQPAQEGGHTHDVIDVVTPKPAKKDKEVAIVGEALNLFAQAEKDNGENRKNADESEECLRGPGQWREEDKPVDPSRAQLVINVTEGVVDVLSGYQRTGRTDWRVFPVEGGDQRVADILNMLLKNISYTNNFPREESRWWEDLLIPGRGIIQSWIERGSNPLQPDIKVGQFPERHVVTGPHEKDDGSDMEYYCKMKWYSQSKAKQLYPEKKDLISAAFPDPTDGNKDDGQDEFHTRIIGEQYIVENAGNTSPFSVKQKDLVNVAKKELRVIECWRKDYQRLHQVINLADEFFENAYGWSDVQIKQIKTIDGFRILPRTTHRWRITITLGGILLSDEFAEDDPENPDLLFAYSKRRKGHWWSKVHTMKDPQREIDKRHSQYVDAVNNMAGRGWFWDDNTFVTPEDGEVARTELSKSGFWQKVSNTQNVPIQGGGIENFPTEIIQGIVIAHEHFQQLANIPPSQEALEKSGVSGTALVQKEKRGLLGNQYLFDTASWMKQAIGRRLIRLIKIAYTPQRMLRLLGSEALRAPDDAETTLEELTEEALAELQNLLENDDMLKYDVVVDEAKWSTTMRNAYFQEWVGIGQHMFVPPQMLLGMSDFPEKQKKQYGDMFEAQQKQEQDNIDAKNQVELQKTAMANSGGGQ